MSKDKDNILVDIYNLELTETPDGIDGISKDSKDEVMILEFFKKYDPKVASYVTDYVFNYTNPLKDGYEKRTFEQIKGKSYFQSYDVMDFYGLWRLVRNLVNSRIQQTKTPTRELEQVIGLLEDIKHSLLLTDHDGQRIIVRENYAYNTNIPNEIDLSQYSVKHYLDDFGEYIFGGTGIYLTLGKLKYKLFNAIIGMCDGEIEIKKCGLESCERAFIPYKSGIEQIFCSANHRKRAFAIKKTFDKIHSS